MNHLGCTFIDQFAYHLAEDLWGRYLKVVWNPKRKELYFRTELNSKIQISANSNENALNHETNDYKLRPSHVYFMDVSFEFNKDSSTGFIGISIKLGAMVEFQKNHALYLQTDYLHQSYISNFADGICIQETGPFRMARAFGEAIASPIQYNDCTVSLFHNQQQEVSIQIIKWHPLLEQYVKVFIASTKDYRSGFVGKNGLNLLESGKAWHNTEPYGSLSFQDWWLQQMIDSSSSNLDLIDKETTPSDLNDAQSPTKSIENEILDAKTNQVQEEVINLEKETAHSDTTKRKIHPNTNSNGLMHGFIRHKKKKTGKLVYQKI